MLALLVSLRLALTEQMLHILLCVVCLILLQKANACYYVGEPNAPAMLHCNNQGF